MKIRYYGHVGQLSGYGQAGADLCMSLLATGQIDLEIRPLGVATREERDLALSGSRAVLVDHLRHDHELTEPDMVIVHTLPMDCHKVFGIVIKVDKDVDERMAAKPWVAYTTWEALSPMPEAFELGLANFSQVWFPSSVTARAWCSETSPVKVMPHAFDPATLDARRNDVGVSGRSAGTRPFIFYAIGAWTSRKNPAGILRAWARAFRPDDPVELWLHSPSAHEPMVIAQFQTGLAVGEMAPVVHSYRTRDEAAMWRMHASCDVYVTAARGEAWNLPAFDALLARRHIIAPTPQGSDEFLAATSAYRYQGILQPAMVDVRVTDRGNGGAIKMQVVGAQGISSRDTWLEPDLVELASAMKQAYAEHRRDLRVDYDPVGHFGYDAVGKLALDALEEM